LRCRANVRGESVQRCGSKGSWQTVPDAWAGDRKTPHPQCCRRPWHDDDDDGGDGGGGGVQ